MQGNMTYRKAKKLNAVFLLLFLATNDVEGGSETLVDQEKQESQKRIRSKEYFNEKMKEFERNQIRF